MASLEIKKMKAELLSVGAAKAHLEVRIEQNLEDIERIKDHIKAQEAREEELRQQIAKAEGK
jgi:septal ring factor EnvC (AmiA/AmiB activator)